MKTKEDFIRFYTDECKLIVEKFEKDRLALLEKYSFKRYRRNLLWMGILSVVILVLLGFQVIHGLAGSFISLTILYAIIAPFVISLTRHRPLKALIDAHKRDMITRVVSFIDHNFIYKPEEGISLNEFNLSRLNSPPDRFKSSDLVYCETGANGVKMSLVKWGPYDGTFLDGFYAICTLPLNFPSEVTISSANHADQSILGAGFIEFEKTFSVKSSDSKLAKFIITQDLAQLLLMCNKDLKCLTSVAFFDNQIHIYFHHLVLFPPYSKRPPSQNIAEFFYLVSSVIKIAEAVKLE